MKDAYLTVLIQFGQKKGKKLSYPINKNLRPTLARARDVLFNWLKCDLKEWRCLDLFAGTGILGIQALSLGAAHVDFVESDIHRGRILQMHLDEMGYDRKSKIWCQQVQSCLQKHLDQECYDLIFLDPPFDQPELVETVFNHLGRFCSEKSLIYFESPAQKIWNLPAQFSVWKEKKIGDVVIRLFTFHSEGVSCLV